jgi:hypothetical protein
MREHNRPALRGEQEGSPGSSSGRAPVALMGESEVRDAAPGRDSLSLRTGISSVGRGWLCPEAAVRAVPARLLLLCLLLSISWLTVEPGVRSAPPECCIA